MSAQGREHLMSLLDRLYAKHQTQGYEIQKTIGQFRKTSYRMAKAFNALIANHQAWFIDELERRGFTGKDRIDKFREQYFAQCVLIGEDYNRLCACVHDGMSEKEYIQSGVHGYSLKAQRDRNRRTIKAPLPPMPSKEIPIEDAYAQLKTRHEALEWKHDETVKCLRRTEHRIAVIEHENKKLRRIVDKMDVALSA